METENKSIHTILHALKVIEEKKKKEKSDGRNFNIFSLLGVQSDEVKLHSTFLADLLNPNGTHGQGDFFLNLFMKECCKEFSDKAWDTATVSKEYSVGTISDDLSKGGRLDILIELPSCECGIAIENKIYASDQERQLDRYYHYLKEEKKYKNFKLFYLTIDGHNASCTSVSEGTEYSSISYAGDIVNWLEKCLAEKAANLKFPSIIEGIIRQYIDTIKELSGTKEVEYMNNEEKDQIIGILSKDNNLEMFEKYAGLITETKNMMFRHIVSQLNCLNNESLKLYIAEDTKDFSCKESWFSFIYQSKVHLTFMFNYANFSDFFYGILINDIPENMKLESPKMKTSKWWYCWEYFDQNTIRYLTTEKLVQYYKNSEEFIGEIKKAIDLMLEQIKH